MLAEHKSTIHEYFFHLIQFFSFHFMTFSREARTTSFDVITFFNEQRKQRRELPINEEMGHISFRFDVILFIQSPFSKVAASQLLLSSRLLLTRNKLAVGLNCSGLWLNLTKTSANGPWDVVAHWLSRCLSTVRSWVRIRFSRHVGTLGKSSTRSCL